MKQILLILFLLTSIGSFANDSTLYQKRLRSIEELYTWLSKRPYQKVDFTKADTNHLNWKAYDTVLNVFFDWEKLTSILEKTGPDDIFKPSAKYQILKLSLAKLHELTQKQCFGQLNFKPARPWAKGIKLTKEDSLYLKNTIIQYFTIDKKEVHWTGFTFVENGVGLLEMPVYAMSMDEYKSFKVFYDTLKPCYAKTPIYNNHTRNRL